MAVTITEQIQKIVLYNEEERTSYFASTYNKNTFVWNGEADTDVQNSLTMTILATAMGEAVNDDYFTIVFNGVNKVFTFKTTPDTSGYQLPLRGGMSKADHADAIALAMQNAPEFATAYTVTGTTFGGEARIIVTSTALSNTLEYLFAGYSHIKFAGIAYEGYTISIKNAEIWFNGSLKFTNLIPDGVTAKFNVQQAIMSLFDKFKDDITYQASDIFKFDASLFRKVVVRCVMNYTDDSSEYAEVDAYFVKSVQQHFNYYKTSMFEYEPQRLFGGTAIVGSLFLIPGGEKKTYYSQKLKIFKGYPLDITLIDNPINNQYSVSINNNSGITQSTTGGSITADDNIFIKRFIISDGENLHNVFTSIPNFTNGQLNLIFDTEASTYSSRHTASIELVDECGVYLKWFNPQGGWSYWLFHKNSKITNESKSLGKIIRDDALSFETSEHVIGTESIGKIAVGATNLSKEYLEQLLTIANSPCVYLYTKPKGSLAYDDVPCWYKLSSIINFKYTKKPNAVINNISFEFFLPQLFTQTL